MTEKTRTEYSARNTTVAMISRMIAIVMGFVTRVVFTHTLSESYVGINGLFTDILNVLALSELGVGTAITYALYRPIAENDVERQKSLMKVFQGFYQMVALIIAAAGLMVIPFMGYLVKDAGDVEHIIPIYLLYLLNSVLSYLFVYKKTLMDAHQLSYIGVMYHTVFLLVQDILQIAVLLTTGNFIVFLLIYLGCTVANNVCVARKADRLYPYLRDKDVVKLPKEEKQGIFRNIRAMLMHKIGNVVVNNTDNLLISAMVGIISAGLYSNYYLIIGSVRQVLDQALQGITASVGNLGVTEDSRRVKKIFEASFFVGQWMYGFAAICLFELLNPFVEISFGTNYVFPFELVLVLCMNFYVTGMRQATLVFRDSLGLFWYDRYKSLFEAGINLAVSVVLTLQFGIIGVFLGTLVSTVTTSFWIEPYVLYKKHLHAPVIPYFIRYAVYTAVLVLTGLITNAVCVPVEGSPWKVLLLRLPICLVVPNVLLFLCYHRTEEFRFLWRKALHLIHRKTDTAQEIEPLAEEEQTVLEILRASLVPQEEPKKWELSDSGWNIVLTKADCHAVLPLFYDVLEQQEMPETAKKRVAASARKTVQQSYRLLYRSHMIAERLAGEGITAIVLKGVATAGIYPVPELRKSGDIDMLLPKEEDLIRAREITKACGFRVKEEQPSHHHLVMTNSEGIDLELHTMLAEPFDNAGMNRYMEECLNDIPDHVIRKNVMGYDFPVLSDGYHAYELLLHMLQHFLRAGFGLKLLSDWVLFWNRQIEERELELYERRIRESGLCGFSEMITSVCVYYLGLRKDCQLCEHTDLMSEQICHSFVQEILEAEEFGKSRKDRMVTLRGTGPADYIREFHHQMHLNFPKAGKVFLLWPVLWCVTLIRFMRNNRRIRGVSETEILKKAGARSKMMKRLELFRR